MVVSLVLVLGIIVGTGMAVATPAGPADAVVDQDGQFQQTTAENGTTAEPQTNTSDTPGETVETNETPDGPEGNETDSETVTTGPGAHLSGFVGAHQAELRGDVSERAFGLSIGAAASNSSKAAIIDNRTAHLEARLQELQNESATLETAYENDQISNGTYQAQSTRLTARINSLERMINQTSVEGAGLPADVRNAHGINMTRLAELQAAAGNATGPEMAAIARSIAGPKAGHPGIERGPPAHAGPSMDPPSNVTPGGPDTTSGPPTNSTMGPPDDSRMGPLNNSSMGPPTDRNTGVSENRTIEGTSTPENESQSHPGSQDATTGSPDTASPP